MATERRINEIVEHLQGTCLSLNSALTESEQNDNELLLAIEQEIFLCAQCGWWCEVGEAKAGDGEEDICEDCYEENDNGEN